MDAITLLKDDHRSVEKLFKAFEAAGPRAKATKKRLVASIVKELSAHAAIEEQHFYPTARRARRKANDRGANDIVLESLEEHHIVKWVLSELDGMDPSEERFDAKVTVLIEMVRHHVKEEEGTLFPEVRKAMSRAELAALGDELAVLKRAAPTRPHPRSPDEPPGNLVAGAVAAGVDRVRDAVRNLVSAD